MFDPIRAAEEIKSSYIDYITTTFDIADKFIERVTVYKMNADGKRRITVEWKI